MSSLAVRGRAWSPLRFGSGVRSFLSIEHRLVGASLLRIGAGCVILYYLLGHWAQREFLWGPHGVYPLWLFHRDLPLTRSPSFFAVESEVIFQVLYVAAIAIALLYTLGWQTRLIGIWFYVATWSILKRNPLLLTGGDTIFIVALPFLLCMNTSAYLSIDSRWRGLGAPDRPRSGPFAALLHNVALFCILLQLCIVYAFSGLFKLVGDTWRDGTAVYYALRAEEFVLPGLSELVYLNPVLVPLLTYGTLAFEISFPFLVWSRRTRWIVALGAVTFHLGIAVLMGLVVFAAQMLIFQLVVFSDEAYRSMYAASLRAARRVRRARRSA